jgi:hypothetical protein
MFSAETYTRFPGLALTGFASLALARFLVAIAMLLCICNKEYHFCVLRMDTK